MLALNAHIGFSSKGLQFLRSAEVARQENAACPRDSRHEDNSGVEGTAMEYKLKHISTAGIAEAIAKAELYRSLNEPEEAESICRDILTIEPQHQFALRLLGLALTDQFAGRGADRYRETELVFQQLTDPYERLYYNGILCERRAKAQLSAGQPPCAVLAFFEQALRSFAEAEDIRPSGNDDAILRWNRCVRLLQNPAYGWDGLQQEVAQFEAYDAPPR
jgi:hypothetical protein